MRKVEKEAMTKLSLFIGLTPVLALAALSACVSSAPMATIQNLSFETRQPAAIKTETLVKRIELHDAVKTDFEVGDLKTKTFSIESREDRLAFKVQLESILAGNETRMPKEAKQAQCASRTDRGLQLEFRHAGSTVDLACGRALRGDQALASLDYEQACA